MRKNWGLNSRQIIGLPPRLMAPKNHSSSISGIRKFFGFSVIRFSRGNISRIRLKDTPVCSTRFPAVPGTCHATFRLTVVSPCVQVPVECGSLRERTFSEIWNNSPALEAFRVIRFSDMPKCASCDLFAYCRPCPGLNLVETGSIATPPQRMCKEAEYMKTLNKKRR